MKVSASLPTLTFASDQARTVLLWAGLGLLLSVSCWLRARYLWAQPFDYDEGHWLMFGVLVNAGYPPYTTTFVGIPPLALLVIQLGATLFDTTLAVRYPMMLLSLLGIIAMFGMFQPWQSLRNLLMGIMAATFLSFNVVYFRNSASIMAEVPSIALALLSLTFAWQYCADRKWLWLPLSGAVFALSLALKVFVVFLPALLGLLILMTAFQQHKNFAAKRQSILTSGAVWLAGFLGPLIIFFVMYDPQAFYEQVFAFRFDIRDVWEQRTSLLDNAAMVGGMWLGLLPLVIGAILGTLTGWRRERPYLYVWLSWLMLATILLMWHIPLRQRYEVLLVPPLAALSGVGLVGIGSILAQYLENHLLKPLLTFLIVGIIGLVLVPSVQSAMLPPARDTFPDLNLDAVQYVWQHTTPDDCLITDDQRFAFAADRLVPPALSETSWARIITGHLTTATIAQQVIAHDCPMVVYADQRRFNQQLPDLHKRLQQLYFLKINFGQDVTIYTGNRQVTKQPATPLAAQFSDNISLVGVDVIPATPWYAGQDVRLATYWHARAKPQQAYKIFLQLRNQQGETKANFDHFPFPAPAGMSKLTPNIEEPGNYAPEVITAYPSKGMWPAPAWPVGQTIREVVSLPLPPDLTSGVYALYIGLYNPETLARLPTRDSLEEGDEVLLGSFEVLK